MYIPDYTIHKPSIIIVGTLPKLVPKLGFQLKCSVVDEGRSLMYKNIKMVQIATSGSVTDHLKALWEGLSYGKFGVPLDLL